MFECAQSLARPRIYLRLVLDGAQVKEHVSNIALRPTSLYAGKTNLCVCAYVRIYMGISILALPFVHPMSSNQCYSWLNMGWNIG